MKPDRELVDLANKGDSEAFEALYYRYRDWVYRLAWRFTGHQQDALDVLQDTFVYLLGKFPGFELTASMTTFLYQRSNTFRRRSAPKDAGFRRMMTFWLNWLHPASKRKRTMLGRN